MKKIKLGIFKYSLAILLIGVTVSMSGGYSQSKDFFKKEGFYKTGDMTMLYLHFRFGYPMYRHL